MTSSQLRDLVRASDPVDEGSASFDVALAELLDELEALTRQAPTLVPTPRRPRQASYRVAVAAFLAVVLVLGVAAVVLSTGDPDEPIVDAPTTTVEQATTTTIGATPADLTAPPVAVPKEALAVIDGFVAATNAGDVAAVLDLIEPDTLVTDPLVSFTNLPPVEAASLGDSLERAFRHRGLLNHRWAIGGCSVLESGRVRCTGTIGSDLFTPTVGAVPMSIIAQVAGEQFSYLVIDIDTEIASAATRALYDWLEDHHPSDLHLMKGPGTQTVPKLTDESFDLWQQRVPEFLAFLSQPSAEDQALIDGFVAAYNAGDVDGALSFIGPDTRYWEYEVGISVVEAPPASSYGDAIRNSFRFGALMNRALTISECSRLTNGEIRCVGAMQDALFTPTIGDIPTQMDIAIDDGAFTLLAIVFDFSFYDAGMAPFWRWVEIEHPDDVVPMKGAGTSLTARLAPESFDLWRQRVPEYLASLES